MMNFIVYDLFLGGGWLCFFIFFGFCMVLLEFILRNVLVWGIDCGRGIFCFFMDILLFEIIFSSVGWCVLFICFF